MEKEIDHTLWISEMQQLLNQVVYFSFHATKL